MARNDEERQRERDREETVRPGDDAPDAAAGDSDLLPWEELEDHDYPASADELRAEYAGYEVETDGGTERLEDRPEPAAGETFASPPELRERRHELSE